MSETIEIKLPDLSRVALEPGDVLLLRAPFAVDHATQAAIRNEFSKYFPGHGVFIMTDNVELAVVRSAPEGPTSEEPFDRLVRLTETHLRLLKAEDFSASLVDRLRRDDCMHDWSNSMPLRGYDDEIECLECGLRVIDGYRPYYPKKAS